MPCTFCHALTHDEHRGEVGKTLVNLNVLVEIPVRIQKGVEST